MTSRITTLKTTLLAVVTGGLVSVSGLSMAATPVAPEASAQVQTTVPVTADAAKGDIKKMREGHWRHYQNHHHAKHWKRGAIMIPGVGPIGHKLIKTLELTDAQKTQLGEAKQAQKEVRKETRELMKKVFETRNAQLKDGKLDPRASIKAMTEVRTAQADKRQEVQDKWLAVWDGLSAEQQQTVVKHLQESQARHLKHRQKHDARKAAENKDIKAS